MATEQSTPATTSQPSAQVAETPLAKASRVAGKVNLESVRFVQFSALAHGNPPGVVDDLNYTSGFTRPKASERDGRFIVTSTFIFSVRKQASEGDTNGTDTPLASLRATTELTYTKKQIDEIISEDDIVEFVNVNVPFNSWGYWREFVQSALSRLGFAQVYTLPLFRVQTAQSWMINDDK